MLTLLGTYQYGAGQKSRASKTVLSEQCVARSSLFFRSVAGAKQQQQQHRSMVRHQRCLALLLRGERGAAYMAKIAKITTSDFITLPKSLNKRTPWQISYFIPLVSSVILLKYKYFFRVEPQVKVSYTLSN